MLLKNIGTNPVCSGVEHRVDFLLLFFNIFEKFSQEVGHGISLNGRLMFGSVQWDWLFLATFVTGSFLLFITAAVNGRVITTARMASFLVDAARITVWFLAAFLHIAALDFGWWFVPLVVVEERTKHVLRSLLKVSPVEKFDDMLLANNLSASLPNSLVVDVSYVRFLRAASVHRNVWAVFISTYQFSLVNVTVFVL